MTRLMAMTFFGKSRVEPEKEKHIHESPWTMTVPLVVLAVGSLTIGFLGTPAFLGIGPNRFDAWMDPVFSGELYGGHARAEHLQLDAQGEVAGDSAGRTHGSSEMAGDSHGGADGLPADAHDAGTPAGAHGGADMARVSGHGGVEHAGAHDPKMEWMLMLASLGLAAAGIALGLFLYLRSPGTPANVAAGLGGLYRLVRDKYRVDELYDASIVRPLVNGSRTILWQIVDVRIIDFFVNFVGIFAKGASFVFRFFQTGYVQAYAFVILLGLAVILLRVL
jgi:NADH-quinone oxidoreductase subunit L